VVVKLALTENVSLVGFDARLNPGCTDKIEKQINLCMLKNIEKMKRKSIQIKSSWLRPELYTFGVPIGIVVDLGLKLVNTNIEKSNVKTIHTRT